MREREKIMITRLEVNETNNMIEHENLDVRTITLGISLLDCCDSDLDKLNEKILQQDHDSRKGSCSDRKTD